MITPLKQGQASASKAQTPLPPIAFFGVFAIAAVVAHGLVAGRLDASARQLSERPGFELWKMLIALQILSWMCALPPALRLLLNRRAGGLMQNTLLPLFGLVALLMGPFVFLWIHHKIDLPLNGASIRLGSLWAAGALVDAVLLLCLMSVGARAKGVTAKILSSAMKGSEGLECLTSLRADFQATVSWAGLVLSLAVLTTGALVHFVKKAGVPHEGLAWSAENVIGFGIYNTTILALAYVPAWTAIQKLARELRDQLFPQPTAIVDSESQMRWLKARSDLGKILQAEGDAAKALLHASPIVAPLLSSLLTLAGLAK